MVENKIIEMLKLMDITKYKIEPTGVRCSCPLGFRHVGGIDNIESMLIFSSDLNEDKESWCHCNACNFSDTSTNLAWTYVKAKGLSDYKIVEAVQGFETYGSSLKAVVETIPRYEDIPNSVRYNKKIQQSIAKRKKIESSFVELLDGRKICTLDRGEPIYNFRQEDINSMIIPYLDKVPDYFFKRGFTPDMAQKFNIGYMRNLYIFKIRPDKKFYLDYGERILIPVKDISQRFVGWSSRTIVDDIFPSFGGKKRNGYPCWSLPDNKRRYSHQPGFKRNNYLYGEHLITREKDSCILVEGFFDVIKLTQFGYRNVLGVMGTGLGSNQLSKIKRFFKKVIILMDGDGPGEKASRKIQQQLSENNIQNYRCDNRLYWGKDPGDFENANEVHAIFADSF